MLRNLRARAMNGLGQCSWIDQGTDGYFWGEVLPNGSIESCPSGGPPIAPPTSPSNTSGQNIINENQAFADNPNLNSSTYFAAESAAIGAAVGTDAQNTLAELATYCQQNLLNAQEFGDPVDTATCNGAIPLPGLTTQAITVAPPPMTGSSTTPAPATGQTKTQGSTQTQNTNTMQSSTGGSAPTSQGASQSSSGSTSSGSGFDLTAIENWFTGSMFLGIPNWALVAGAVAAVFVLPKVIGGRR